jgi:formylglycine-generating enzyme required for sulfatase activity
MPSPRDAVAALVAVLAGTPACLDAPRVQLELAQDGGAQSPPQNGPHDGMVLVPETTLAAGGTLTPAGHGNGNKDGNGDGRGEGDGNGDGGGKGGAGGSDVSGGGGTPPLVVASFWLDAAEVSTADWNACVLAGTCAAPSCATPDDHPVTCVARAAAAAYCAWRGKRLVRRDEWTAAAAGAAGRPFPWGTATPAADLLNACGTECGAPSMYPASDGWPRTAPRGVFPRGATPEGVLDLAGNVAEWTDEGELRGGSFLDVDAAAVASGASRTVDPESAEPDVGLRCAGDR